MMMILPQCYLRVNASTPLVPYSLTGLFKCEPEIKKSQGLKRTTSKTIFHLLNLNAYNVQNILNGIKHYALIG